MRRLILLSVLLLIVSCLFGQNICDPAKTRVLITGVLQWQDPGVNSFSDENRKDQELHDVFSALGIPDSANSLLLDNQGTLEKMNRQLKRQMKACDSESTFIFYYAGHGSKIDNSYYFCNYDMGREESSMFNVNTIAEYAKLYFKGKRIILLADCCYSGSLLKVGEEISKSGIEVVVLTSASSSNISTGNWTYTQTLLDMLHGRDLGDHNKDGKISLAECSDEVREAMKYREYQLYGYAVYNVNAENEIVGYCKQNYQVSENKLTESNGAYCYALDQKGKWRAARILGKTGNLFRCEFYNYSVYDYQNLSAASVRTIYFPVYQVGKKVEVEWEGKYYPAEITSVSDAFMYIHYTGYDKTYDEWVMYDRIKTGNEISKSIEWEGTWYPGIVLEKNDTACFITYEGYDHTWDEWVSHDRVK